MTRSERYTCAITRDRDGRITAVEVAVDDLDGGHRVVRLEGERATHVAAFLQEVLRSAGLRGRQWTSPKPFALSPTLGAHAELLLRTVKPLRRIDRIVGVAEGVAGMSREEASYWHAQTRRRHGLKALRVLLDGGYRR
ncbi:hypothetical protein TH66_19625 [Carbonactinospora thermoautotrophica]|uniref:DUF7680 domain-containing protein n=1 Tax=Carbonactinospora thermoautotrophica TaxID=1469144 RepID=A0A132MIQ2_9ACTN|nr:hypothetical protein [Carbonactinospora thermoautotrophica]KWW97716.1 hypothetical protein TH66_19625 [Carbonactinospora thermoautotrophica]KWW98640.1 hypothetical protein LI90_267 [Carbonactinospora thermoautotrophica]KWX06153.1 hypothetical protein TR74_22820 [Carbonactinospora thermoautotrophica]